jgi:hypothetical protein
VAVAEICERQPDVTLALVGCIVHCHQQPFSIEALLPSSVIVLVVSFPCLISLSIITLLACSRMPVTG